MVDRVSQTGVLSLRSRRVESPPDAAIRTDVTPPGGSAGRGGDSIANRGNPMTATIHDFRPAAPGSAAAGVHTSGPLKGLPVRGRRPGPSLQLVEGAAPVDEAVLAAQLLLACAPPRLDKLEADPAVIKREGVAWMPVVIVDDRGLQVIASADAVRRIAVAVDVAGRTGAALDLMQAADQAEALAALMQRGAN